MIQYLYLGRVNYAEGLRLQGEIAALVAEGRLKNVLLLLEHPPVLTLGRNANRANVLASDEMLAGRGVTLHEINRGGDVTYHGPGQIVAYPIVDLREWKRDVGAFVRAIEQTLIDTLEEFGIVGVRIPKLTGVWVRQDDVEAKVAAIGVHLSRWVSTHGLALNVTTDLRYFDYIVPCGLKKPVTSMERLGVQAGPEDVKRALARHFGSCFEFDMRAEVPELTGAMK